MSSAAEPKLSCRNVWKLYGPDAGTYFNSRKRPGLKDPGRSGENGGDPKALAQQVRDAGGIVAAANVGFDVFPGEIFVIMGLSGSGKSTVVRCLSRLVEPSSGEIRLDGQNLLQVPPKELINIRRHKMGMVFQSFGLMPHLNVRDNVAFPLKLQGMKLKQRSERAQQMIGLVGLEGRELSFPEQLSGGQQQRVGIARSLAVEPDVWFLDEPFSALDPLIRRQMQDEFLRLQQELNKSIVFITHDFLEALRIADRMAIMDEGEIVQIGRPVDLILNPANAYVREFTKDVPLERFLTAGDIVRSKTANGNFPDRAAAPRDAGRATATVTAETCVADFLPQLAANEAGLTVTGLTAGEPVAGEPKAGEPVAGAPKGADPTRADPTRTDPARTDPARGQTYHLRARDVVRALAAGSSGSRSRGPGA